MYKTRLSFLIREFNCVRVEHYHSSESSLLQQHIMIFSCSCKKEKKKEKKKNNNGSLEEQQQVLPQGFENRRLCSMRPRRMITGRYLPSF
jgi:hypothetical protein